MNQQNTELSNEAAALADILRLVCLSARLAARRFASVVQPGGPVIRRLSRKVDTTGLIKPTILTVTDCVTMHEAFGRCSALLHSQPGEINPRLPSASAIESEISTLANWIADIRARQEKAA